MNVLRFADIENIEYRKGSSRFGQLLLRLMEFLRMYKTEAKDIVFKITDFELKSNIRISELQGMMNDEEGRNLYKFDIIITKVNITFTNLTSNKSRFFENVN